MKRSGTWLSVLLALCLATPMVVAAESPTSCGGYFLGKKPFVSPRIVQDLQTWISDEGEQVVAINLPGAMDTNRYFGDIDTTAGEAGSAPLVTYQDKKQCDGDSACPAGPPSFSYRLLGRTASGVYVLLTTESGGGYGRFENLLLVTLTPDQGFRYRPKAATLEGGRPRCLLERQAQIPLGDRYAGAVTVKGNWLFIGHDNNERGAGLFPKDVVLTIPEPRKPGG